MNSVKQNIRLLNQIQELSNIIAEEERYLANILTEFEVVTDQYMNGNIHEPIGKYQNKLSKEARRIRDKIRNDNNKLRKLQMKII